ncbi:Gp19/Gp15/Gp42 family protein [Corynebacterium diphtheriae]
MGGFAEVRDVRLRWGAAPDNDDVLEALIEDASVWLKALYPSIPSDPDARLRGVLKLIVCSMVKRASLEAGTDNLASVSETAGPFTHQMTFRNSDGNLFLTQQEREMLESALDSGGGMVSVEAVLW